MINNIKNNNCIRKKLNPWLIGLVGLIVIVAFFLIFRIGQNDRKNKVQEFTGVNTNVNNIVANNFTGSYHQIVDIIRPAVVGISLPGAQPFVQALGAQGAVVPPQAGANQGMRWWNCPKCQVGINCPLTQAICPQCPMCGINMSSSNGQAQVQPQAQTQPKIWDITRNCLNCGKAVTRQPEIPWESINCPGCGNPMVSPLAQPPQTNDLQSQPKAFGVV
jgi:hypothetical protein